MKKILFVCHGNICRSPMAEFVMKDLVKDKKLDLFIESAATSTEALGCRVHRGTREKLGELGISTDGKYAVQMTKADYSKYDYIIAMDNLNVRNIMRIIGSDPEGKVHTLLSFAGSSRDISDPWYTGDFDKTYDDVLKGCTALFKHLEQSELSLLK